MESLLKRLTCNDVNEVSITLEEYTQNISTKFCFPELNEDDNRIKLWEALCNILKDNELKKCHKLCFQALRMLSRDKTDLNKLVTKELLNLILQNAGLAETKDNAHVIEESTILEALMCLCNVTYNATIPRNLCYKSGALEVILRRLHMERDTSLDIIYFDMKILFIITALCEEVRKTLRDDMNGFSCLIEYLEMMLKKLKESNHNADVTKEENKFSVTNINIVCEILKTLFNLTLKLKHQKIIEEEEESQYLRLVKTLHDLLLINTENEEKKLELDGHVIHLLLNMPNHCLKPLVTPIQEGETVPLNKKYQHYNMSALQEVLQYLRSRFDPEPIVRGQLESLTPILSAMVKLAKSDRIMRKYLRMQVLPPLKDTHTRPEQGNTIRNCLCRLLTSPITQVRDLAADFVFILCKENVGRMIKYTGYGNAAGMFATRGLLDGTNGETENYSSEDEDSETEEYNEYKHGINPVTGCYQEPRPNPTANMTEEQKEYEAMKLVNLMDKMTRQGVVKPCRIGPDGKPQPIEHVLQLQEELQQRNVDSDNEDQ